jgi:hydrogenase/urease accessory protein HupE
MSTVSRVLGCWIFPLALWISPRAVSAHPVAQGAMLITISPQNVTVRVTVSIEEVLVADAYGPESSRAKSAIAAAEGHGAYLLKHLRISADGRALTGERVHSLSPILPERPDRLVYEFIYPLSAPGSEFRFEEDVLNEIEFAPGNRWETSYIIQLAEEGRTPREGLLMTSRQPIVYVRENPSTAVSTTPRLDRWQVFRDYFRHGLLHILTGYDHLLFITALVLAVRSLWELVKVVTAFTAAHSITLALSAFDLLRLPSRVVEPMIAASIVFVALQNAFWPGQTRGWTRLAVAFFFGLFHGLGFAGGLLEAMQGMTTNSLALAIIGFSAGVEFGHQVVVLPTFCALKFARGWRGATWEGERQTTLLSRWGSVAIAIAGATYLVAALRAW